MIVCRSKGFIFLRVPKTASSSLSAHLCNHIEFDSNVDAYSKFFDKPSFNISNEIESKNEHATLSNFLKAGIIKENDLCSLKIYGVLREPIERTISMFSHLLKFVDVEIAGLTNNRIIEQGLDIFHSSPKKYYFSRFANDPNNKRFFPLLPQSNWLMHYGNPISNIIIYPNFSKFLFDVTSNVELNYRYNSQQNHKLNGSISEDLIKELKKIYSQDFILWKKYEMTNYDSTRAY